jgi:hypothetical protein
MRSLVPCGEFYTPTVITAAGLNADGANVAILGANHIADLQGAARNGNFAFETPGSVNLSMVDTGNAAPGVSATGIAQIIAGGNITSAITGSYAVSGGAVVLDSGGSIGAKTAPLEVGTTVLAASGTTGVAIELNTFSPAFAAVDTLVNSGHGDILLLAHGGAKTRSMVQNLGGDISIKTFSPLQVVQGADASGGITLQTGGSSNNDMLLNGVFRSPGGLRVIVGPSGFLSKGPNFSGNIIDQVGGELGSEVLAITEIFQAVNQVTNAVTTTTTTITKDGTTTTVTDQDEKKDNEKKDKKGFGACKP